MDKNLLVRYSSGEGLRGKGGSFTPEERTTTHCTPTNTDPPSYPRSVHLVFMKDLCRSCDELGRTWKDICRWLSDVGTTHLGRWGSPLPWRTKINRSTFHLILIVKPFSHVLRLKTLRRSSGFSPGGALFPHAHEPKQKKREKKKKKTYLSKRVHWLFMSKKDLDGRINDFSRDLSCTETSEWETLQENEGRIFVDRAPFFPKCIGLCRTVYREALTRKTTVAQAKDCFGERATGTSLQDSFWVWEEFHSSLPNLPLVPSYRRRPV